MPKVTIEVSRLEETQIHRLLQIEKGAFPGRRVVRHYHGAIARIEVEGDDANELIDLLCIGVDDARWLSQVRNEDQRELRFIPDPIDATAG